LKILPLTSETIDLEIDMCQQCHPSGYIVDGVDADEGRKLKKAVFEDIFRITGTAGSIPVEDGAPVSLLELMPRVFTRRNGYITGSTGSDYEVLTIVCLEVAHGRRAFTRACWLSPPRSYNGKTHAICKYLIRG